MFRIKTIAFVIVVLAMVLSACQPAAPATPEKKVWTYADMTVGFLQTGSEGGWRAANTASFKETATQLGLTLKFYDSQNDLSKQVAGFQQFIQDPEVDVIVMSPLEVTGWDQVLKDAKAAGKPVILSDRRIDGFEDYYVTFIGADFVEEGRKAGTEMCKMLDGSAQKNVWELVGNVGASRLTAHRVSRNCREVRYHRSQQSDRQLEH
jgi:simple sugar transport system substrate-binding protein